MPLIRVPTDKSTIQLAVNSALIGDTIRIEVGYATAESVLVSVNNLIFEGLTSQTGITLSLASSIASMTMTGTTPFNAQDNLGNNTIVGNSGNNTIRVTDGLDNIDGGLGSDDVLVIDYSTDTGSFSMNGPNIISDFSNTNVSFSNIERFNATFGSGTDNIVLLGGNDTVNGGAGDDSLNTAAGAAVVDGGVGGNDLWLADFSADVTVKNINLNLAGIQSAGNGTTYVNIERMNIQSGAGNDVLTSRTSNANDGFNDTLNGGAGNDTLTVGGGLDSVDGGVGSDDLLVINYSTDGASFFMNGPNIISDFSNTSVSFSNIERFNATFGSGTDNIVLLGGNDTVNGGPGDDSLNTAAGAAVVDGGVGGNDLWLADFSADVTVKNINLNLAGIQSAGNGTTYVNIERMNIQSGAGNDVLTSRTSNANDGFNDTLNGGAGNDTLTVGGGLDSVDGGVGSDDLLVINYSTDGASFFMNGPNIISDFSNTSVSFSNIERFNATFGSGNDNIVLLAGNDTVNGGTGNDSLDTAAGAAIVDGGVGGNDLWLADFSADATVKNINLNLAGIRSAGNGTTYVNIERMNIQGGAGNDVLTSHTSDANDGFNDTLNGGAGNDTLTVGGGLDFVDGGVGGDDLLVIDYSTDTGSFSLNGPNIISDFNNTSVSFSNIERFNATFGSGNDNIVLLGGNDTIDGGVGNDSLNGAGGIDTLSYTTVSGNITVNLSLTVQQNTVSSGFDTVINFENLTGGNFDDTLSGNNLTNTLIGGLGNDILNGGGGVDTLSYATATGNVNLDLGLTGQQNTGSSGLDTVSNFENLSGSDFNDTLTGNNLANTMIGGKGNDILNGASGVDTLSYASASGTVTVDLGVTVQQNTVSAGLDTLSNFENLIGSNFDDTLTGNNLANTINGGKGNDILNGLGGADTLTYATASGSVSVNLNITAQQNTVSAGLDTVSNFENLIGGNFNDTLAGNTLANLINGGKGNDSLSGGTGKDNFVFDSALNALTNSDVITDFNVADDTIRLQNAIFTQFTATGAIPIDTFVSGAGAVALDANDFLIYDTNDGNLYYDADGNGAASRVEFLTLTGIPALTVADFVII